MILWPVDKIDSVGGKVDVDILEKALLILKTQHKSKSISSTLHLTWFWTFNSAANKNKANKEKANVASSGYVCAALPGEIRRLQRELLAPAGS